MSVVPGAGKGFSTDFNLNVGGCYDKDNPLSYKYILYETE